MASLWRGLATPARPSDGGKQGYATLEPSWAAARRPSSVAWHGGLAGTSARHRGCLVACVAIRGPGGARTRRLLLRGASSSSAFLLHGGPAGSSAHCGGTDGPNSPRPSSAPSRYRREKSGSTAPASPRMGACFRPFLRFLLLSLASLSLSREQHGPSRLVTGTMAAVPQARRGGKGTRPRGGQGWAPGPAGRDGEDAPKPSLPSRGGLWPE